jgi:integrase/recombinase XerD
MTQIVKTIETQEPQDALTQIELVRLVLSRCDIKESSKKQYKYGISRFITFCAENAWHEGILLEYKDHLRAQSVLSASTKAQLLNAARVSCRHLYNLGLVQRDLSGSVKAFKVNVAHKRAPIAEHDRKKVFRYLNILGDTRATLIFHLLAFQGLRRMEVCSIRAEDYNASNRTLLIDSKGVDGKTLIHLHSKTVAALNAHLASTRISSGFIFPSSSSTGYLSTVGIHRIVQEVHKRCFLKANVHAWRKYFTSTLLENGFDVITASKFTRHKSIATLSIYYDRVDVVRRLTDFNKAFESN